MHLAIEYFNVPEDSVLDAFTAAIKQCLEPGIEGNQVLSCHIFGEVDDVC